MAAMVIGLILMAERVMSGKRGGGEDISRSCMPSEIGNWGETRQSVRLSDTDRRNG